MDKEVFLQSVILDWLKTKQNYCYYQANTDNLAIFQNRLSELLLSGRVHIGDLKPSDCYIVENIDDVIEWKLEHTAHAKHTFDNFNVQLHEHVYNNVKIKEASKIFESNNCAQQRKTLIELVSEFKKYNAKKNALTKELIDPYALIFSKSDRNSVEHIIDDIKNSSISDGMFPNGDIPEYMERVIRSCKGLQEIGIFCPFKFDHDIFAEDHYLFEINHLKFRRKDNNFLNLITNFYQANQLNNCFGEVFTLKRFFAYPGNQYIPHFAYFDPFKHYEKYLEVYKKIKTDFKERKLEFNSFIFELFEIFNQAQIGIVKFQHANLIDSIYTNRSLDRQYTARELADEMMKRMDPNCDLIYMTREYAMLHFLKSLPSDKLIGKNIKIKDLEETKSWSEEYIQMVQSLLDELLNVLNKDSSSRLQNIMDHYNSKVVKLMKKYRLKQYKDAFYDMLLDLVYFYSDRTQEKLLYTFNSTIKEIYQKNQHRSIDDIVDFDFEEKFVQFYRGEFEKHQPLNVDQSKFALMN